MSMLTGIQALKKLDEERAQAAQMSITGTTPQDETPAQQEASDA